ncbi:MAG: SAM-dependent methyltransferase [Chloroflexota bacterium]
MAEVEERIKQRIREQGQITFAQFMEMALYYPGLGYYTSPQQRIGADGDFFTSPATHPLFAALIGLQLEEMWQLLGTPADFTVVELGAGSGLLGQDILTYLPHFNPRLSQSMTYIAQEKERSWVVQGKQDSPQPHEGIIGCFLSNEFFDALPTHRVLMLEGKLKEIYVTLEGDQFKEVVAEPSTPLLEQRLAEEGILLSEGYTTEINLEIDTWVDETARRLKRGFVLTIDYGYEAQQLYSPQRKTGTMTTYFSHNWGVNPYLRAGERDMSTHVDFTALIGRGQKKGLHCWGLVSQRQFLLNLGLDIFAEVLSQARLPLPQFMSNRYAMMQLIDPEGLGQFKVLVQGKGLPESQLWGLTPDSVKKQALRAMKAELPLPLAGEEHTPLLQGKYPHYDSLSLESLFPEEELRHP